MRITYQVPHSNSWGFQREMRTEEIADLDAEIKKTRRELERARAARARASGRLFAASPGDTTPTRRSGLRTELAIQSERVVALENRLGALEGVPA